MIWSLKPKLSINSLCKICENEVGLFWVLKHCDFYLQNSTLGFHWTMNLAITSMRTYFFSTSQEFAKWLDSSKIRDLYLMNWPYKMLQNLSYFWNKKTYLQLFSVYGTRLWQIWSISLGPRHIIKHKLLITEEWLGGSIYLCIVEGFSIQRETIVASILDLKYLLKTWTFDTNMILRVTQERPLSSFFKSNFHHEVSKKSFSRDVIIWRVIKLLSEYK